MKWQDNILIHLRLQMQIFHRIKICDVATGTAKVEFSDVSSQAKDMIETIDNAQY